MEQELVRWSLGLNVFLFFMCLGGIIGGFFWGLGVGQRLGRGEPVGLLGGQVKGEVWQADDPSGGQNPGTYQSGGASALDPLSLLDEHINRNLKQMHSPRASASLLDPELAGKMPTQAGRGGE